MITQILKHLTLLLVLYTSSNLIARTLLPEGSTPVSGFNGSIPQLPPGMSVMAGYIKLQNPNKVPVLITSLSSTLFNRVEIHKTISKNGMLSMQKQNTLIIPANGSVILKPGGLHLMLIGPKRPLRLNETVIILIKTKRAYNAKLKFVVKSSTGNADAHKHHHHH